MSGSQPRSGDDAGPAEDIAAGDRPVGNMAALVRHHPWADTPLGDRSGWPAHRSGFVDALLLAPAPMASFWGPEAVAVFNDAFAALLPGPPADRLGRLARARWPEIAGLVAGLSADAADGGHRAEGPAELRGTDLLGTDLLGTDLLGTNLRAVPILAPDGAAVGVLVTASPPAADSRRGPEARQALLLGLADTFRSAGDSHAVVASAVAALGRETGAARALFAEVDPAHHDATVEAEWSRADGPGPDAPASEGPGPDGPRRGESLDALAFGRRAEVEAGLTVVASGIEDEAEHGAGGAGLAVPLVRDGRLRALFHLAAEAPRRWRPEEVALVEDVAARSWDALERIASATLLRRNQARQSFLLVLGDRLREAADAAEVAEITAEALGRQLHAARAGYGELSEDGGALAFGFGWAAAGTAPLDGILPLASLGPGPAGDLARGLTAVFDRGGTEDGRPEDGGAVLAGGLATAVAVPLIRDGRLRGVLTAAHAAADGEAHRWSAEEIALVGEVASRMWEALERARAEAALIDLNATLETRVARRTAELASSEARFRILFENAPAAIVLIRVGRDGRAVFEAANAAAEAFLSRDVSGDGAGAGAGRGIVGRDVSEVTGPDDPLGGHALACAASGEPVQYEATFAVGGRSRTAEGVLAPLSLGDGDGAGESGGDGGGEGGGRMLIGISRDITAQRSVEEQLRQAQKMEAIGQLTGGIAHDFNNLLTGIIGSLALMQKRLGQGRTEALERYAGLALASANRAAALTHRLLAFSRRQPLEAKAVDANALVLAMEELLRRTLGEGVVLRSVGAPGLWPTLCDPHQLENALLNLAINARDAMPDGGRLTIETANAALDEAHAAREPGVAAGDYVMVSVSDTGSGMPPEVVARAFDPFFTTKPIGQGTGLGLSMIYGFVKQSDGHIAIQSEPGRGTTVRLFLPRCRGAGEPAADPGHDAAGQGEAGQGGEVQGGAGQGEAAQGLPRAEAGETVLLVEDEHTVRHLVIDLMGELGYAVRQAADGPTGLAVVRAGGRIDLLVTDVGLPGMNGRQFAAEARALRPDLKVLFITGYAEDASFGDGHLDPGMQMMTKPFALDALARRIRAMIGSGEG